MNDTNEEECFKREVNLHHISWLPCLTPVSQQVRPKEATILDIKLPSKVRYPIVLNKYLRINYINDIDEGLFDHSCYGKAVVRLNL